MRLLYATDFHGKAKNPVNRKDVYPLAFLRKLMEIANTCHVAKIDAVIIGGDLWDLPRVSPDLCGSAIEIIKSSNVPWYVVPGNHDVYGYNYDSLNYTMLGVMAKAEVITILNRKNPTVLSGEGFNISLQGQEHTRDLDHGNPDDYRVIIDPTCKWHILVAHGMVVDKPYIPEVPHTVVTDIDSNADLVLLGHYHPGFNPIKVNNTMFINPGSALRVEASASDNRIPQFVIIEATYEHLRYKMFPFRTAQKPEAVLDFSGKQQQKHQQAVLNSFKQKIIQSNAFSQTIDVDTALQMVINNPANNIDPALLTEARNELASTQQSKDDAVPVMENFVESPTPVYIDRIEAENFMSYDKLDIELSHGLNVIRGESNNGKTNILRLIDWVEKNEPKGDSMISNWANSCWARITYSNGYVVERGRSRTSAGYYEITDPQGNTQRYEGFGNNIPPEVFNATQRPYVWITKDDKRDLSFASQLEPAFLVTESAPSRAAAIGRLTNVQNVDATIRRLNAENRELSKEIKIKQKLIDTETKKLVAFADLPDKLNQINQFQLLIENAKLIDSHLTKCREIKQVVTESDNIISAIDQKLAIYKDLPTEEEMAEAEANASLIQALNKIKTTLHDADLELEAIKDRENKNSIILSMENDLNTAEEALNRLNTLVSIKEAIEDYDRQIKLLDAEIANRKMILDCDSILKDAEEALELLEKLYEIKDNIVQADTELKQIEEKIAINEQLLKIGDYIDDAEACMEELTKLISFKNRFDELEDQLISIEFQYQAVEERIHEIDHKIDELLGTDAECPTCGSIISKERLIGGVVNG